MKKIKWFFIETIISLLQLIAILFISNYLSPYLITAKYYDGKFESVTSLFPVAIYFENKPKIIRWDEYIKSPKKYNQKLIKSEIQHYKLDDYNSFDLYKKPNNVYNVKYSTDEYIFWSSYSIEDGKLLPLNYRLNGPFVAFPLIIILIIITIIINKKIKRHFFKSATN